MVYNRAERILIKKKRWLYSEEYVVIYNIQGEDGYWKRLKTSYFTSSKADHDKVKERFVKDFPMADIVSIVYQ